MSYIQALMIPSAPPMILRQADGAVTSPDDAAYLAWLAAGNTLAPIDVSPVTAADYAAAIEQHVNATARARGYANTESLASYITSTVPQWQSEAATFVAWRDAVWVYAYTELGKVQGGNRSQPTIAALIAELPAIEWA